MPKFIKKLSRAKRCPLCIEGIDVDYHDVTLLRKHISERGQILGRGRTGICANHQRQITKGLKRARYLAMLPFVQG